MAPVAALAILMSASLAPQLQWRRPGNWWDQRPASRTRRAADRRLGWPSRRTRERGPKSTAGPRCWLMHSSLVRASMFSGQGTAVGPGRWARGRAGRWALRRRAQGRAPLLHWPTTRLARRWAFR